MRKNILVAFWLLLGFVSCQVPLLLQPLDYTEYPVDIPNPDRGFYRPQSYVVPVEEDHPPDFPALSATIAGTNVSVDARIVYMEFDLRNFSSNAPLNGMPAGPWGDMQPDYGVTQPLTPAALDYIWSTFHQIRESDAVAIVKFSYDGRGFTYNNRGGYDQFIHDCEPGAPQGRTWYESGGRDGGVVEESDLCGIPGHEEKNWVQYHLWQLKDIFKEFEDVIMCVKGGFFGPWGEMHSSSYARTSDGYHWLLNALLEYVPDSRSILVHAGGVMAWHNVEYGTDYSFSNIMPPPAIGTPAQRFGMFNDSYSRGGDKYTDGGSLSEGIMLVGGEYDRNGVLTWIRNQNNFYGGETVRSGNEPDNFYWLYPRFPNVPYEAAYARTTHLNTNYSSAAYSLWDDFAYNEANITEPFTLPHDGVTRMAIFDPLYDGRTGMEFMRDRLGYRLVLREAKTRESVKQNGILQFEGKIQNVGYGLIVNRKDVWVMLKSQDDSSSYAALTDLDARNWRPDENGNGRPDNIAGWHDMNFSVPMNLFGKVPVGEYDIYLQIRDPKESSTNKRTIRFVNNGDMWNAALGANLIGSITVK